MDIKQLYPGGEPKISNPDLLRMPYSNYYGIQQLSNVLGDCIVSGCDITVNSISYTVPRIVDITIGNGWAIVGGELTKVDEHNLTFELVNNVPAPGSSWYINMSVESSYDSLGDKTFNDSTARRTWLKRRGVCTNRQSYNNQTTPTGTFDIALFSAEWDGTPSYSVYMYDDSFMIKNFDSNWSNKYTNLSPSVSKLVATDGTYAKDLINGPSLSDLVLKSDTDYVYTKTIELGFWNMNTGYTTTGTGVDKEITFASTGIPESANITEMHVTINSDNKSIITTDYTSPEKPEGPVIFTTSGTPKFTIANPDKFAGSSLWNDTSTNRGYLTIKYIL